MTLVHILRTSGHYIGQVRGLGCRRWRTVTGTYRAPERALAAAVRRMATSDHRARALLVPTGDTGSYYGPTVAMEAHR